MQSPIVTVTGGQIKGCQKTNLNGETFYSFLGIPFGKPPTGELRFKAPEAVEPWTGIKDATKDGDVCYQRNEFFQHIEGSEDCLHLNVFTKTVPKESCCLRPVMVWIYGGAFTRGSNKSVLYGPEFLMTENIVLVCINYRVGFLGFLHLEDASLDVPGNAGLKDQQLALKWVQKNIANFNGDPNNVTIFGESAGSASVHYHVLSPTSAGLFHKAIMQSGCLLNPWPTSDYYALRFAKSINEKINTEEEALNLFKSMNVADFYAAQEKFYESVGGTKVIAPNIEKPNPTAVISSPPAELLLKGQYNKVPILMGYCNKEGLLLEFYKKIQLAAGKTPDERLSKMSFEKLIPSNVNKEDPKVKLLLKKIMDTYIEGPNVTDKFALSTDYLFLAGILATAKLHAKTSSNPVYLYRVSLDAGLNLLKKISKLTEPGVCHADELGYLFNVPIAAEFLNKGETEEIAIKRFVKLWTNFAKTGNPTPETNELNISWRPLDTKEMNFLDIGTELTLQTDPEPERMAIWKEIFQLHPVTANFL